MALSAAPKLQTLQFLGDLGLEDEEDALEADMIATWSPASSMTSRRPSGPVGDRVKYEYAAGLIF